MKSSSNRSAASGSTTITVPPGARVDAGMRGGGHRVAEVVQGVGEADQVVALAGAAGNEAASATSKLTRSATPASAAALRAAAITASLWSNPVNDEAGNRSAIRIVEVPWPQPTSATRPPACSRAVTPSSAAIQPSTSAARYIGRVKRAWASLSAG